MADLTVSAAVDGLMQCVTIPNILEYLGLAPAGWVAVSTNTDASVFQKLNADTSGSSFTITLPPTPTNGDWVRIQDAIGTAGANNIIVDGNSEAINNSMSQFVMATNNESCEFVFVGGERGWRVQIL